MQCAYAILSQAPLYTIFPHYLINDTIFKKKGLPNVKSVSIFCTTFVWCVTSGFGGEVVENFALLGWVGECSSQLLSETFFILQRNERDISKKNIGLQVKNTLLLSDFNKTLIFQKSSDIKINENSDQWEPSFSIRTDMMKLSHFSQICEGAAYCHRVSTQLQLTNIPINDTRIFMLSAGFELAIPAITRVQTYALDCTATRIG
jgi:hypothetical protein